MAKLWLNASDNYEVNTEVYSGPLDLLLDLIQKAELDITRLALAKVTDQFLSFVENNQDADPDYLSEFLLIAAKLVQIKSEAMLPRPPVRGEDEEDVGATLARQLIVYREIKKATAWLNERTDQGLRGHLHVARSYPVTVKFNLDGMDLTDLVLALENLANQGSNITEGSRISIPKMTLRRKVQDIMRLLREDHTTRFSQLLGENSSRLNAIVVFLAILELVKQDMISTEQDENFADISITAQEKLFDLAESELVLEDC